MFWGRELMPNACTILNKICIFIGVRIGDYVYSRADVRKGTMRNCVTRLY